MPADTTDSSDAGTGPLERWPHAGAGLVVNYGAFADRNTGIPEILVIPTGTRNSGVLRSGNIREQR